MGELKCGIYCLYWTDTKYYYIGKPGDINSRYSTHLYTLRNNIHPNKKLTEVYIKFGEPLIKVIEICDYDELKLVELKHLKPAINDGLCCNMNADKTPSKIQIKRAVSINIRRDHYKAIRIKFKTIQGFIDAYINAGLPDL